MAVFVYFPEENFKFVCWISYHRREGWAGSCRARSGHRAWALWGALNQFQGGAPGPHRRIRKSQSLWQEGGEKGRLDYSPCDLLRAPWLLALRTEQCSAQKSRGKAELGFISPQSNSWRPRVFIDLYTNKIRGKIEFTANIPGVGIMSSCSSSATGSCIWESATLGPKPVSLTPCQWERKKGVLVGFLIVKYC